MELDLLKCIELMKKMLSDMECAVAAQKSMEAGSSQAHNSAMDAIRAIVARWDNRFDNSRFIEYVYSNIDTWRELHQ